MTHSVVVMMFRRLLERWDEAEYMRIDKEDDVKNCSITTYLSNYGDPKLRLKRYNYTDHLGE